MLIGYVSDERYVAVPEVLLEFEGETGSFEARSNYIHAEKFPPRPTVNARKGGGFSQLFNTTSIF